MRQTLFDTVAREMRKDSNLWFLTGDVGWGFVERLQGLFPDRFINCGIAEQNMVGIASGLAVAKKRVFVYSMSTFVCFRAFEQIRNCVAYEKLPITIVGIGGKDAYPGYGVSHNCPDDEDLKIMSAIPMAVHEPKDTDELKELVMCVTPTPRYIRIKR